MSAIINKTFSWEPQKFTNSNGRKFLSGLISTKNRDFLKWCKNYHKIMLPHQQIFCWLMRRIPTCCKSLPKWPLSKTKNSRKNILFLIVYYTNLWSFWDENHLKNSTRWQKISKLRPKSRSWVKSEKLVQKKNEYQLFFPLLQPLVNFQLKKF